MGLHYTPGPSGFFLLVAWRNLRFHPFRGHFHRAGWVISIGNMRKHHIIGVPDFATSTSFETNSGRWEMHSPTMGSSTSVVQVETAGASRRVSAQCWLVDEDCIFGTVPGRKRQGADFPGMITAKNGEKS